MKVSHTVFCLVALLAGSTALAQEEANTTAPAANPDTPPEPKIVEAPKEAPGVTPAPESAVLPERVARFRFVYGFFNGDKGYDKDGKEVDAVFKVNGSAGAAVAEYGVTDDLSLQLLVPYTIRKDLTFNDSGFDHEFNRGFAAQAGMTPEQLPANVAALIVDGLAENIKGSFGGSKENAKAALEAGQVPATAIGGTLSFQALAQQNQQLKPLVDLLQPANLTGSTALTPENIAGSLRTAVAKFKAAQRTAAEGAKPEVKTGLGDIELGAKYAFSTVTHPLVSGLPLYASAALGVRLNTSGYKKSVKAGEIPAGRGTTDYGLRLNIDYHPVQGIGFSVENQLEGQLLKGKTYDGTKEVDYERVGVRNVGYGKVVVGPGAWVPALEFLTLTGQYGYDFDAATKTDGVKQPSDEVTQSRTVSTTLGLSGFPYQVPLQLDLEYKMPVGGKNVQVATSQFISTLKMFYKF